MIPYAKRRGRCRLLDRLPPDAYPVLDRMLRAGYCVPYIAEQVEARFDCVMPSPRNVFAYCCYAIERDIPRPGPHGYVTYVVATLTDPDRPFRATLAEMAARRDTLAAMCRALHAAGAPLAPGSRGVILSAIRQAGFAYMPHGRGGFHGRYRRPRSICPVCGAVTDRGRTFCGRECYLRAI